MLFIRNKCAGVEETDNPAVVVASNARRREQLVRGHGAANADTASRAWEHINPPLAKNLQT